ncbi:MAG: hypothetical protein PHW95_03185 [Patescibacteria group bacterium]|nr:hypothetical protein [Patescibacteria group bacterium]
MSIIISQSGKNAQKIDKSDIVKEDELQSYIHQNPESIPIYEIEEDKRLFVAAREFSTEAGPIDALAVDKDGDIYIVETKLYKNPERRTVVGQALDYGASLWRHSGDVGEFVTQLDEEVHDKFGLTFAEKVTEFFNLDEEGVDLLLEAMRVNLREGNIKFVILMDSMGERLKDLIMYVNQNSQFDIFAVEMEFYKFKEYEIVIPKLFGAAVKKIVAGSSGSRVIVGWTPEKFLADAKSRLQKDEFVAVEKLFLFSKKYADDMNLGNGKGVGSINPIFKKFNTTNSFFCLKSNGTLGFKIPFALRPDKGADEHQKQRLNALKQKLEDIDIPVASNDHSVHLTFSGWAPKVDVIIDAMETILKQG